MSEATKADIQRAAGALRDAHGQALGAIEESLRRLTTTSDQRRTQTEAEIERERAIRQTRASNEVMAAQSRVRKVARELVVGDEIESLRVAQVLELGELVVNARSAGLNAPLDLPLLVPLFGAGGISVFGGGEDAADFVRNIQLESMRGTAPGQLSLVAYDPRLTNPLAPFAPLGGAVDGLVRTLQTAKDLEAQLSELSATIARVGDQLQGGAGGLIEYRRTVGMPVEQYHLVCFHDYPKEVDEQQHRRILTLARAAPRHGLAFVFHLPDLDELPSWCDPADLRQLGESFDVVSGRVTWAAHPELLAALPSVPAAEVSEAAATAGEAARHAGLPTVPFADVEPPRQWGESSATGLSFAIGRAGHRTVEIALGDERVNAVITGAVGQGKSNLLKVIVHSLCARYSPDELSLFLLDMKEGVTLAPMAPSVGAPECLPHATVLGLEADKDFGVSVLRSLLQEYRRRSRLMKSAHVEKLADYRAQVPKAVLPRIVLIIDEFHLLLDKDDEKIGTEGAKLLEELVRLGRASGIHVILASQTISGISTLLTSGQGIFAQFPIRLGLKNSPKEAVAFFGQGNDEISRLRARGEALLNLDHGAVDSNQRCMVAAADDGELAALRRDWYGRVRGKASPLVFDGSKPASLIDDVDSINAAREQVRGQGSPRIFLGRPVAVETQPATFELEPVPGKNLAIVGAASESEDFEENSEPDNSAIGILQSAGIALARQYDSVPAEFVVLDLLTDSQREQNNMSLWLTLMGELGHEPEVVDRTGVKSWIIEEAEGLTAREQGASPRFVLGFAMDRAGPIEVKEGMKPAPAKSLQALLRQGPTLAEYFFGWWTDAAVFLAHLDRKTDPFNGSVLLRGADAALGRFHGPLAHWSAPENRGLFSDSTASDRRRKIIPYQPVTPDTSALLREGLRDVGL